MSLDRQENPVNWLGFSVVALHPHPGKKVRMKLTVGEKVYYPGRGPCLVGAIVQKVVCGMSASFYQLTLLDGSGAELFVPVGNFGDLHVRSLLNRSEIPKLLRRLKPGAGLPKEAPTTKNWRQRELDHSKLFNSGSTFDLADMIESLTQLKITKTLSLQDRDTLYRARQLLIGEISAVMDESRSEAEARIDSVLEPAKKLSDPPN
jgi:RNA polymerase-interacting CarD/CdnL/TRCF family regulator